MGRALHCYRFSLNTSSLDTLHVLLLCLCVWIISKLVQQHNTDGTTLDEQETEALVGIKLNHKTTSETSTCTCVKINSLMLWTDRDDTFTQVNLVTRAQYKVHVHVPPAQFYQYMFQCTLH